MNKVGLAPTKSLLVQTQASNPFLVFAKRLNHPKGCVYRNWFPKPRAPQSRIVLQDTLHNMKLKISILSHLHPGRISWSPKECWKSKTSKTTVASESGSVRSVIFRQKNRGQNESWKLLGVFHFYKKPSVHNGTTLVNWLTRNTISFAFEVVLVI